MESQYCHDTFQPRLAKNLATYDLHAIPKSHVHVVLNTSLQDKTLVLVTEVMMCAGVCWIRAFKENLA